MAIVFNCPHCLEPYRLKDEFGGKQAKCKNPECRQLITIPKAFTIREDGPKLSDAEAEAAALAALNEEAPKEQEHQEQKQPAAPAEKVIPVTCQFCDHKWTEPWSKAGKNTLCPNPECRQRVKVPEPKEEVPTDWRQAKSKLPSMAKQNFEKLEDVQDAGDAKVVSGSSLREADATGVEYEPRPLKQKVMFVLLGLGLVGALGFGGCYFFNRRTTVNEEQLMADARNELTNLQKEWAKAANPSAPSAEEKARMEWVAAEGGLFSAILNLAGAEYALRHDDAKKTKEAHELFGKATNDLRLVATPGQAAIRNVVAAELVFAVLTFGGTEEQAKEQLRIRWEPGSQSRLNERVRNVHEELRITLDLLTGADYEFRISVARRLARELTKRGYANMAADLIPQALFTDAEKNETRAVIALEIYRTDRGSDVPGKIANDLKTQFATAASGNRSRCRPSAVRPPAGSAGLGEAARHHQGRAAAGRRSQRPGEVRFHRFAPDGGQARRRAEDGHATAQARESTQGARAVRGVDGGTRPGARGGAGDRDDREGAEGRAVLAVPPPAPVADRRGEGAARRGEGLRGGSDRRGASRVGEGRGHTAADRREPAGQGRGRVGRVAGTADRGKSGPRVGPVVDRAPEREALAQARRREEGHRRVAATDPPVRARRHRARIAGQVTAKTPEVRGQKTL